MNVGIKKVDTDKIILQKRLLNLVGSATVLPAAFWGVLYYLNNELVPSLIMFSYTLFGLVNLVIYLSDPDKFNFNYLWIRFQVFLWPILIAISLGGHVESSFIILWSFTGPLTSLLVEGKNNARKWFIGFLVAVILIAILPPVRDETNLSDDFILFFTILNLVGMSIPTYFTAEYAIKQRSKFRNLLELEKTKSEHLLLNVLPPQIIPYLQESDDPYVQEFGRLVFYLQI